MFHQEIGVLLVWKALKNVFGTPEKTGLHMEEAGKSGEDLEKTNIF